MGLYFTLFLTGLRMYLVEVGLVEVDYAANIIVVVVLAVGVVPVLILVGLAQFHPVLVGHPESLVRSLQSHG